MSDAYDKVPLNSFNTATEVEVRGSTGQKQGHSCCGCCCDMRRAVIICNVYMITSAVLWFCLEVLMYAFAKTVEPNDPRIDPKDVQNLPTGAWIGFLTALTAFQCTLYGFGVQGAFTFKKSLVVGALFSYKLNVVYHLMMGNTIGICLSFFLAYPNVVFFLEVDHHIMTPEKYPNEAQSCCCI